MNKKICVIVPGYNEEKVIKKTLSSLKTIFAKDDIYMVDDGSKDNTAVLATMEIPNVLLLRTNVGKANAINAAMKFFQLTEKYEYIAFMDSDTVISKNFIDEILPIFDNDKTNSVACVMGQVTSRKHNWITSYRTWEYEIAQTIHKSAQDITNTIVVSPGCSSVYRSSLFKKISVPHGTLAEDMDLTFKIHRKKLGKIIYKSDAFVITQDPRSLKDFIKQIDRWYTGFWQCVIKHNIPWGGQKLDAEVTLLALEGLFNGLLVLSLIALTPFALLRFPQIVILPFFIDLFLFLLPTIAYVVFKNKDWKILLHLPGFYVIRAISSMVFIKSFIKIITNFDSGMTWYKAYRYRIN